MKSKASSKQNSKPELSMFEACEMGDARKIQQLLAANVSVDVRDQRGNWTGATPLMYATKAGQEECVKMLLAAGADPNLADSPIPLGGGKRTALYFATQTGNLEIATLLVEAKANVNFVTKDDYGTALSLAVSKGNETLVKLLLRSGADPNIAEALYTACANKQQRLVPLLIEAGADVNKQGRTGSTPLMSALLDRQKEIVFELFKHNPRLELTDIYGMTALMWAVISSRAELVELLIAKGARINAKDKNGMNALDYAVRDRKRSIIPLLQKFGAKSGKWR